MAGALEGVRVLDLSRYIAGPFCSMLLGDMGADVVKVEKKGVGEDSRKLSPFSNESSLYYTTYNRNKRSITIDFRNSEGKELLKKLVAEFDILIENFRPGTLDKIGLSKEELEAINPGLIVISLSGFGQDGPYRDRVAFDCIAQAMSGLMSLTGTEESGPTLAGTYIADFLAAIYGAFGAVTALYNRFFSGTGQMVDIFLLDGLYSILATAAPDFVSNKKIQRKWGNRDKVCSPATTFKAKNGYIYIHGGTDPLFERLVMVMEKKELLSDSRFKLNKDRMENIELIESIVQEWVSDKTVNEIEDLLVEAGVPVGPVNDLPGVLANPQLNYRKAIEYLDYPDIGKITVPGVVVKMSKTPGGINRRPPLLGEHCNEVLTEMLGYSKDEIDELRKNEAI